MLESILHPHGLAGAALAIITAVCALAGLQHWLERQAAARRADDPAPQPVTPPQAVMAAIAAAAPPRDDAPARLVDRRIGTQPLTPLDPLGRLFSQAPGPWFPIPGDRLELRDTGYAIELHALSPQPYWLFNPEGYRVAVCADLDSLKRVGEQQASQRAEFVVRPIDLRWLLRDEE